MAENYLHNHPPVHLGINENPKNTNSNNISKRLDFYHQLAEEPGSYKLIFLGSIMTFISCFN